MIKQKISNFFFNTKTKLQNLKTNQTFLICSLLTVIYLISGYWKWLEILVSVCALVFLAIIPLQSAFCVFMFLHSFTLSNIGFDSCFMVTLIGFCIVLLVKYILGLRKGQYQFHKKLVLTLAWFLAISIALSLFHNLYRGAWLYLTYIPFFYLIFAMKDEFNIVQGMNYMLGGLLISSAIAIISLLFPYFQYEPICDGRFRAFINNANYLYMRALFVVSYYMYRYLNKNLSHLKFIFVYLFCAILTLATLSKTGIGMFLLFSFIFVVLYLKQDFKKHIKIVGIMLCVFAVACLFGYKFILAVINRFVADFNSGNFWTSLLTGRDEIWMEYLKKCFENPFKFLFGHGILAEEVFIPSQNITRASHNLYIFMLYRFGAVGCFALGVILFKAFKTFALNKPKFIAFLPLIFILVESLFDNTFKCYHFTYFAFAVMILFIDSKSTKNTSQQQKIEKFNKI